jgi:hypothetical protein
MFRRTVAVSALLVAGPLGWWSGVHASSHALPPAGTTCTWGGTATDPTGTFTITPGVTQTPSTEPSTFFVTGTLAGDAGCTGTLRYVGQVDAGSSCSAGTFEGATKGLPGVRTFAGVGVTSLAPARLYDASGNVVASENANLNTADNIPHFTDCNTPAGFRGGNFHSVIVFTK